MSRILTPMAVPRGEHILELLPALADALRGRGPARLLLAQGDPRADQIAHALGAGQPLGPGEDDPADPTAFVVTTSGSTGMPKGVLVPAGALAASAAATEERLGGPGHWLLTLPAHHIAGLQVLLRAAAAGTEPVVMNLENSFTATDFVTHAQRLPGPRRYVSLVPTQLRRLLADPAAGRAAAEIFDAILVGGAATPPTLLAAARNAGMRIVTTYGMTETCGGCVYDGAPLPGASAELGPSGAIELSGPMVTRGYRYAPDDPAFATPGTFVTADAGRIADDGRLTVLGRLDDVIVTGGEKVAPTEVEAALTSIDGIADACVVGVDDAEWGQVVAALVVAESGWGAVAGGSSGGGEPRWAVERVRAALSGLPAAHRPHRVLQVDAIPLLASGKPDRRAASRQLESTGTSLQ